MFQKSTRQKLFSHRSTPEQAQELIKRSRDPGRVMALTDGVFAIIMTLLVLEIHVPQLAKGESLSSGMLQVWPNLVVFVISFILTGMYWVAHRDMFTLIRAVDRRLVWLNILYMLPIALVPFAAALLGEFSQDALAIRLYGLDLLLISLFRLLSWYYVGKKPHLLIEYVNGRTLWSVALTSLVLILFLLIAMLFAGFAPNVSLSIYAGVPLIYFIGVTFLRRLSPKGSPESDLT